MHICMADTGSVMSLNLHWHRVLTSLKASIWSLTFVSNWYFSIRLKRREGGRRRKEGGRKEGRRREGGRKGEME